MDPDAALNRLLRLAGEEQSGEWGDTLLGLDEWISRGGVLPERWRQKKEEPSDTGGFFVSTYCNCAHDLCTGEAVDNDHEDCWIHPLALRVEAEFGVDVLYRLTEDREGEVCAWFLALLNRDMDDLDIEEAWAEVKGRLTEV